MSSAANDIAPNMMGAYTRRHVHAPLSVAVMMTPTPPLRSTREALRAAQRRYLDLVLAKDPQRRSLSEIARAGGLNHTTLTRFYNKPDEDRLLETMTLQAIARSTGIPVPADVLGGAGGAPGLTESEALPYSATDGDPHSRAIEALMRGRNAADPLILQTRALEDAGYLPGDVVILDQAALPAAGDAVCAQIYDRSGLSAETVWRIFQPPFLVAASRDPAFRRPIVVDGEFVLIRGVITDTLRRRPDAA